MKMYIIAAVLILGGVGLITFITSDSSLPIESERAVAENEVVSNEGAATAPPVATADPVATVNGEEISNADFSAQQSQLLATQGVSDPSALDSETQTAVQTQVLDSLISQKLLIQAAAEEGIEVSETEIDTQLNTIRGQFKDESMYEQALASEGLTEAELRAEIAADLSIEPYLDQVIDLESIAVTEDEVNQVYEEASAQQELPPLEEVRGQIEQTVLQQKQQPLIDQHIAALREVAEVEIYI